MTSRKMVWSLFEGPYLFRNGIFYQKNRTLLVLISSFGFDDNIGQTFGVYIIAIAGAESVIGLSILVAYYRLNKSILFII